jgi:hypothetical protein
VRFAATLAGRARCAALVGFTLAAAGCAESKASEATVSRALVGPCGDKGLPDCPLQSWMKANLQARLNAGDLRRLAPALDELASRAPAGFAGWKASATRAAEAARRNDVAAVKAECKSCHDQDRSRYRAELRNTHLF